MVNINFPREWSQSTGVPPQQQGVFPVDVNMPKPQPEPEALAPFSQVRAKSQEENKPLDEQGIKEVVDDMNKVMKMLSNRLEFGIFAGSKQLFVRVLDSQTSQVVKVMPPEALLELRVTIREGLADMMEGRINFREKMTEFIGAMLDVAV